MKQREDLILEMPSESIPRQPQLWVSTWQEQEHAMLHQAHYGLANEAQK